MFDMVAAAMEKRASAVNLGHPRDPALAEMFGSYSRVSSGANVTAETALRVSAVFACVRVATETIASLPVGIYKRTGKNGRDRELATDYPTYHLLKHGPNPQMTRAEFFEEMNPDLELRGNCNAHIEWKGSGYPKAIWPLPIQHVEYEATNKSIKYFFNGKDGRTQVPNDEMLHVRTFSRGLIGRSPIQYARESVGLAMAAEEFGSRFFGQGFHAQGWVKMKPGLSAPARKNIQDGISEWHQGRDNSHGVLILGDDGEYHSIGINPDDMQFLETRKFQVQDIARIFRIQEQLICSGGDTADNKLQQLDIQFAKYSIGPRVTRWEQALTRALIPERDRGTYFIEFDIDGLLRGDIKTRFEAYAIAIDKGINNRNEVRAKENESYVEGLDEFFEPMNMGPIGIQDEHEVGAAPKKKANANDQSRASHGGVPPLPARASQENSRGKHVVLAPSFEEFQSSDLKFQTRAAGEEFDTWLEDYYARFEEQVRGGMKPAVDALADAVALQAMNELGLDDPADVDDAAEKYLNDLAKRHAASSKGQLRALLENEDFQDAIEQRLSEWLDKRADKASRDETTQEEGYIARDALTQMGVTAFRWTVVGETCPLCKELDGRIVGTQDPFLRAGDYLNPNKPGQDREDDEAVSLKVRHNIFHPPLHQACDCLLIPVGFSRSVPENYERRALDRTRVRESFQPIFREAIAQLVKREVREVRKRLAEIKQ